MSKTKLIVATSAILIMAAALAMEGKPLAGTDTTVASVTALKSNLGSPAGLEVDEVRVTDDGVACIDYRVSNGKGGMISAHAVVQRDLVLKSSSDSDRFEEAWNTHCLGPRGGMSAGE